MPVAAVCNVLPQCSLRCFQSRPRLRSITKLISFNAINKHDQKCRNDRFDSGENVLLAHNQVEGILGRLFQTFFDRDATIGEWQLGRKAITDHVNPEIILDWFQNNSSLNDLDNTDYIQAFYSQTFGRSATETELNQQQLRLENGEITREWLAVDIANSNEAVAVIGSVILLDGSL